MDYAASDRSLTRHRPQALLVLEGINDLHNGTSIDRTVGALQGVIDISLQRNVPVLIADDVPNLPDGEGPTERSARTPRIRCLSSIGASASLWLRVRRPGKTSRSSISKPLLAAIAVSSAAMAAS